MKPAPGHRTMRAARLAVCCALATVGACDPCTGVAACTTPPRLAIEGTLVENFSGTPQAGVRVDVVRTGGVALDSDSLSTTTDAAGRWRIAANAESSGDVVADVVVRSNQYGAYRVTNVTLATTTRRGGGQVFPPWVVDPHFVYALELFYRANENLRVANARVEFHRTGGVELSLAPSFPGVTDEAGRLSLFDVYGVAQGLGDLIGDLIVHLPGGVLTDTIRDVRLTPTQLLQAPTQILRLGVGPSLLYSGEFHERRTGRPAPGVRVVFQRTAGIATTPDTYSASTDSAGRFVLRLVPATDGTVVGDLHVDPPPPGTPFVLPALKLATFRADGSRLFGVWNEGPCLPWTGVLLVGGVGVKGVAADFHRTGGINVVPSDYTTISDGNGYIMLNPQPQDTGVVEADIVIHSPAPYPLIRARITLRTVQDDTTSGVIAGWDLDRQPPAASFGARRP